jgi:PBP1b-binding outer membrane lipoprotein LpoB
MRRRSHVNPIWGLVAIAALALAGCGRLNRTATLNEVTQTPGAAAAVTVQQQLATHGYPNAKVTCAKTLIVNVGTTTTCSLTGAGTNKIVRFTLNHKNGEIKLSSVTAVS